MQAHERSINTDVLIGLLSRVVASECCVMCIEESVQVQVRREQFTLGTSTGVGPLKLIVMSATLRVNDFTANKKLFAVPPPIVHVPGRTHKVLIVVDAVWC